MPDHIPPRAARYDDLDNWKLQCIEDLRRGFQRVRCSNPAIYGFYCELQYPTAKFCSGEANVKALEFLWTLESTSLSQFGSTGDVRWQFGNRFILR